LLVEEVGLGVLFLLAFTNGANDVGKSIATVVESSGGRSTRRALVWGGVFTGLGSLIAVLVAEQLLSVFTSTLLTPTPSDDFVLAVLLGTTAWVLGATLMRLPVSLTHAIIGAILFETAYLFGASHLAWATIGLRVLLPLAGGPFAALFLTYLLHRRKRNKSPPPPEAETPGHTGKVAGFGHWISAAATALARGINDAPKMVALGVILLPAGLQTKPWIPFLFVALAVFLGSIGWGRRVTRTLVGRLVPMARDRHVTAGVTTAALVSLGAILGAPLSTTHVASGATTGIGGGRKEHVRSTLKGFLLAWFVTLPAAGLLAIGASFAVSWLQPYLG